MGSASEDEEDDDASTASSVLKHHTIHSSLPAAPGETNNNSITSDIASSIGQVRLKNTQFSKIYKYVNLRLKIVDYR